MKRLAIAGILVAASCLAAACGSSSSATPTAPSTSTGFAVTQSVTYSQTYDNSGTTDAEYTLSLPPNPRAVITIVRCEARGGATCPPPDQLNGRVVRGGGIRFVVPPRGSLTFTVTDTLS